MELAEMGGFSDGEWESLSNVFTFDEPGFGGHHQFLSHHTDSTFVAPFTDNEYFYSNLSILPHTNISNFHIDNASDTTNYNFSSQTKTNSYENCHFSLPNEVVSPCMTDQGNHVAIAASDVSAFPPSLDVNGSNDSPIGSVEDNESYTLASTLNTKVHEKRKKIAHEVLEPENNEVVPKKKARVSNNNGKKIIESTENKEEGDSNVGVETKTDKESMASPQTNEKEISASKRKNRVSRGTATDPQSLYARKRREKINERLKILQKLVPNGTKVDISTLLEEAVQYVKFLQLQIRLLSSDDLWMYAPIAYNGVDISLYKRISPFLIP